MSQMIGKVYIGIDPGSRSGSLAVLPEDGKTVELYEFSEATFGAVLKTYADRAFAVLEHVNAMPGQGVVATWHFAENFGFIRGLLKAYVIPHELVRPQKWKKAFGVTADKNTSVAVAQRLFPTVEFRRTPKCRKPFDGFCESLLMAEYARRIDNGR